MTDGTSSLPRWIFISLPSPIGGKTATTALLGIPRQTAYLLVSTSDNSKAESSERKLCARTVEVDESVAIHWERPYNELSSCATTAYRMLDIPKFIGRCTCRVSRCRSWMSETCSPASKPPACPAMLVKLYLIVVQFQSVR